MSGLANKPVEICFFQRGSVEEVESMGQAAKLGDALQLVRDRFPEATLVPCCENEPDGGCVFVYANAVDQDLDAQDAAQAESPSHLPDSYGRWVGVISSSESDEPTCERPRSHF